MRAWVTEHQLRYPCFFYGHTPVYHTGSMSFIHLNQLGVRWGNFQISDKFLIIFLIFPIEFKTSGSKSRSFERFIINSFDKENEHTEAF